MKLVIKEFAKTYFVPCFPFGDSESVVIDGTFERKSSVSSEQNYFVGFPGDESLVHHPSGTTWNLQSHHPIGDRYEIMSMSLGLPPTSLK